MKKYKERKDTIISDSLESILRSELRPSVEFYQPEDLDRIKENWMALEWYNLDKEGNDPDDELDFPFAAIFVSYNERNNAGSFYVTVTSYKKEYLYTLKSLSQAIDLVRNLRSVYTAQMNQERALEKKRAEVKL